MTGHARLLAASHPHKPCSAYCWTPNHPSLRRPPEFANALREQPRSCCGDRSADGGAEEVADPVGEDEAGRATDQHLGNGVGNVAAPQASRD